MEDFYEGKDKNLKLSVNEDIDSLFEDLRLGQNKWQTIAESVGSHYLPKLTAKELELADKKDSRFLETFYNDTPDVKEAVMKLSESHSKFVYGFGFRNTFNIYNLDILQKHNNEFADYLTFHLKNFPVRIRLTSVQTKISGKRCYLKILSDGKLPLHYVNDSLNDSETLQLWARGCRFPEMALADNFSWQKYFTDEDGFHFGVITICENPLIKVPGTEPSYDIKWLAVLEKLEEGHEYKTEVVVII